MITDQVDIRNGVKIDRHYYTPAQLKTDVPKGWDNIDDAISTVKAARAAQATNNSMKENRTPSAYVEVFEVHGVLPPSERLCYASDAGEDSMRHLTETILRKILSELDDEGQKHSNR